MKNVETALAKGMLVVKGEHYYTVAEPTGGGYFYPVYGVNRPGRYVSVLNHCDYQSILPSESKHSFIFVNETSAEEAREVTSAALLLFRIGLR